MKRILKGIMILAATAALCVSFAGCNILTIYRDGGSAQNSSSFDDDVSTTATYGKSYAVKSVDLKIQSKSSDLKDAVTATAAV